MRSIHRLSKSQYLRGLQCPKSLWLHNHRPELRAPISDATQFIFDTGHRVGRLAQAYFAGGAEIREDYHKIDRAVQSTHNLIAAGAETIFEATAASPDGAFSRIDVLSNVMGDDTWDLIEVKQSTNLHDYYIDDIAFQRYAFTGAGYPIRKSILMHLNKHYVRIGDLDVKELFVLEDCTELAGDRLPGIAATLDRLITTVNSPSEPVVAIGRHCRRPFECDFVSYCWQDVPEYSVFNVFRGEKLDQMLQRGILAIDDLSDHIDTTARQSIEIDAYRTHTIYADKARIKAFLADLQPPLYYLDYETIYPAVPLFDRTSPYQQIPFQFSLHVQRQPQGDTTHVEFLHTESSDPRPGFVKRLTASIGEKGAVIVYNKTFESLINQQLGALFPEHSQKLASINHRMVDLMVPFKSRYLYHPAMQGSASIKRVLPAFVPGLGYTDLEIGDGDTASRCYTAFMQGLLSDSEKTHLFDNLRKYCRRDTYAEVRLLEILRANA